MRIVLKYSRAFKYEHHKFEHCKRVKRETMSGIHLWQRKSMSLKTAGRSMGYSCYQTEKQSVATITKERKKKASSKNIAKSK